ncbi:MAG: hypothetical protein RLY20_959 [Verrucomicrobiota bacterium]|jgi:hypothetical protein
MANKRSSNSQETISGHIRFNALGLALFSAALVITSGLLTAALVKHNQAQPTKAAPQEQPAAHSDTKPKGPIPAWGELVTYDIDLEQPEEYVGFELATNRVPHWNFAGMTREQTRTLLLSCGVPAELANHATSDEHTTNVDSNTIVTPDDKILLALPPAVRSKLYTTLARIPGNHYMEYPFCYPRKTFNLWFGNGSSDSSLMATVRKLLYPRGDGVCFSDFEFLMQQTKNEDERMEIVKALSRQSAVLARVRIRPDTDIDKLLGYWGRGIQVKDVRPLVESTARLQDGATISLLYFLPKFARERLYTFPMPSKQGDPVMDCHWSTMNFFNDPPDNRFTETAFTANYIQSNFYQVAVPNLYGDVILILNDKGNAIHSAVYIADDIVFTKNGNNFSQPWMLMRLGDLLARYTADAPPKTLIYRKRSM